MAVEIRSDAASSPSLPRRQEMLSVGILTAPSIVFTLLVPARMNGRQYAGRHRVSYCDGRLRFDGELYDTVEFLFPEDSSESFSPSRFILEQVVIGVGFHWQRNENQTFAGHLLFIAENDGVTAVNRIGTEDYLRSVISSEMKGTASPEFLKAHAVISRSWLLAQIHKSAEKTAPPAFTDTPEEYVRWFDREDHARFDVCADDHCQRYQGMSRVIAGKTDAVIEATWGEVLTFDGEICDARFSKCCGGTMERFDTCWEESNPPYLQPLPDTPDPEGRQTPFCDTSDRRILAQVLNEYDLETADFYRWSVSYTRQELSELIGRRSGIDFGEILDLRPLQRGPSGRIRLLEVVGTRRTMRIGNELIIRKWLSGSHLKSSAFDVEKSPEGFVLHGKGWGHGVGLCQIGAAVMGEQGYGYREILAHYFPGSMIRKRY